MTDDDKSKGQADADLESKQRLHEAAIDLAKQAVTLEPNNASFLAVLGKLLIFAGKPNEAVSFIKKAERHAP